MCRNAGSMCLQNPHKATRLMVTSLTFNKPFCHALSRVLTSNDPYSLLAFLILSYSMHAAMGACRRQRAQSAALRITAAAMVCTACYSFATERTALPQHTKSHVLHENQSTHCYYVNIVTAKAESCALQSTRMCFQFSACQTCRPSTSVTLVMCHLCKLALELKDT